MMPIERLSLRHPHEFVWLKRLESIVAAALTITVMTLLCVRTWHAGPLWRDECATLQLSQLSMAGILQNFQRESFPPLVPLALHCYTLLFGTSDAALRGLGLFVGFLVVGAIWFNAFKLRLGSPLFGLSLLGLSTTFLIWGTGIRGYGIGSAAVVLTFTYLTKLLVKGNASVVVIAGVCVFGVQLLLYNSVLLAAFTLAILSVCLTTKDWRPLRIALTIAVFSALSVVPWLLAFRREAQSTIVFGGPINLRGLIAEFARSLGYPVTLTIALWSSCAAILAIAAVLSRNSRRLRPLAEHKALLFALFTIAFAVILYFGFLKFVSYRTREWYYLALLAVLAAALDVVASVVVRSPGVRIARLVVSTIALLIFPFAIWPKLIERQSNIDVIASKLEAEATPDDLVICNPWYVGISYSWYYRGHARWITCPVLEDLRMHRFDLLKARMTSTDPVREVIKMMSDTLQAHARVWIVGDVQFAQQDENPPKLPPAPKSEFGWSSDAYVDSWSMQLGAFLQKHAATGGYVSLPPHGRVNELEDLRLLSAKDWRD